MKNREFGISNAAKVTGQPMLSTSDQNIYFQGHKQGNFKP